MQTSQIIKRSKEIKMEKPKAEVEQMTYEEYCTYLLKLENEDNNREYEDPIDECRTKHHVYGDLCTANEAKYENLRDYFWSDTIPDSPNLIKFRKMLEAYYSSFIDDFPKEESSMEETDNEEDNDNESLLEYLKGTAPSIHYDIKKFLYLRTQDEDWPVFHHYDNIHYSKKFSVTPLTGLEVADLSPETCRLVKRGTSNRPLIQN